MPHQTSVQVTEATERQVEALKARGFGTFTDIVRIAIDRMCQQETGASRLCDHSYVWISDERIPESNGIGHIECRKCSKKGYD